ncbi:MAG: repressor LexA [Candidatus Kerfeldbacteria bacterium RIFCSPLOWO2_01_FULL_48_11]|uniref:LexA repressor n=1 Tax=Candidatus Kerfeldbacteria bacterium RIFCSPLOWO2_01_FULL_48_11 TaxID=1798543 RepID=A0A1G2AZX6_9BACT|nr:MAG: LexA repressor [Parcubacteria group bacterium GW2011_GWA2_48_9]KKW15237.1 MAG: LexA repressor [Parcubacteria group bacterium GW2011_GWC2_49_9]OGY82501.1 MAG: repressor LexA [Candidatus Kerfeldbacteria bacterium RIFCSPLOWO2_01_FULL_48_11]HCJ52926.1 repressor LexA [Candidatus Kerfeldbacteria bacterium]HCM68604.1 repressor LexA [Candidatus Kerfeldbacteria bacterium]
MAPVLPKQKQKILFFLKHYIERQGFAPTLTEIAKEFGVSSLATVHEHLQFLEKRGFIKRDKSTARGISIVDREIQDSANSASILLPLVGMITAGEPIEAVENVDEHIPIPKELVGNKNAFLLKVKGDSMVESLIADGDLVIVEKTDIARDGDMVIALLEDGSATLKKLYHQKNYIRLQPANSAYKSRVVKNVVIQGRVMGILRTYRG